MIQFHSISGRLVLTISLVLSATCGVLGAIDRQLRLQFEAGLSRQAPLLRQEVDQFLTQVRADTGT